MRPHDFRGRFDAEQARDLEALRTNGILRGSGSWPTQMTLRAPTNRARNTA